MNTELEYLDEMYKLTSYATIVNVDESRGVYLDQTIFYPQGGGQQCDTGLLEAEGTRLHVTNVSYADGYVRHQVAADAAVIPSPGTRVRLTVDSQRRSENSKLHSAGHLIVNAVHKVRPDLIPIKAYHFPSGPYVEFAGRIQPEERDAVIGKVQSELERLVRKGVQIEAKKISWNELKEQCFNVPTGVPADKPTRVVTIEGLSQPCGGTHVRSVAELLGLRVCKIKSRKGNVRFSYSLSRTTSGND